MISDQLVKYATMEIVNIMTKYPMVVDGIIDRCSNYLGNKPTRKFDFNTTKRGRTFYEVFSIEYLDKYANIPPEINLDAIKPRNVVDKMVMVTSYNLKSETAVKFVSVHDCMVDWWTKIEADAIESFLDLNADNDFYHDSDFNVGIQVIGDLQNYEDPDFVNSMSEDAVFTCLEAYIRFDTKKTMVNIMNCLSTIGGSIDYYENLMKDL
jgi:hypothetical protein